MKIEPLQILSADSKETAEHRFGIFSDVQITAPQHAKMHHAVRNLQLKVNELVDVINAMEIPDD